MNARKLDKRFHSFTPSQVIIKWLAKTYLGNHCTMAPLPKIPKIKIEFSDGSGAKYSLSVEGGMSKEKMVRLMEFVDSIAPSTSSKPSTEPTDYSNIDTNFSRLYGLLQSKFKFGSFTSADVMEAYADHYGVETTLSTVSTYLSRLADRGLVTRMRNGSGWIYKLAKIERKDEDIKIQVPATTTLGP